MLHLRFHGLARDAHRQNLFLKHRRHRFLVARDADSVKTIRLQAAGRNVVSGEQQNRHPEVQTLGQLLRVALLARVKHHEAAHTGVLIALPEALGAVLAHRAAAALRLFAQTRAVLAHGDQPQLRRRDAVISILLAQAVIFRLRLRVGRGSVRCVALTHRLKLHTRPRHAAQHLREAYQGNGAFQTALLPRPVRERKVVGIERVAGARAHGILVLNADYDRAPLLLAVDQVAQFRQRRIHRCPGFRPPAETDPLLVDRLHEQRIKLMELIHRFFVLYQYRIDAAHRLSIQRVAFTQARPRSR